MSQSLPASTDRRHAIRHPLCPPCVILGGVDELEPVSGGCDLHHAHEAVGELVVAGRDGAVALLVERSLMIDLYTAV